MRVYLLLLVAILGGVIVVIMMTGNRTQAARASSPYSKYLAPIYACPNSESTETGTSSQESSMRCLINWARTKKGLRKLGSHVLLNRAADMKSAAIDRCHEFSHRPCGKPFTNVFRRAGYLRASSWRVGENIAWGSGRLGPPRAVMLAWLKSSGHRHNIFDRSWRDQGVGLRKISHFKGYAEVAIWSSEFGLRH